MAYKFSLGKYKHSGSLVSAEDLTVQSGLVTLPDSTINTNEISASAVTNAKIALGAVQSGSIAAAAIVNGHIVDATIQNAKLVNTGSILGTSPVVLGQTVSVISGLTALSASEISGGVVVGDGRGLVHLTASNIDSFTADVRSQISVTDTAEIDMSYSGGAISAVLLANSVSSSKFEAVSFSGSVQDKMNAYLTGGLGLAYAAGTFDVNVAGGIKILSDKVALHTGAVGVGLTFATASTTDAVSVFNVAYGAGAGQAVQGNTQWTASAGQGLSGDASGTLGGPVSFTFDVVPTGAVAIKADKVAISSSLAGVGFNTVANAGALEIMNVAYGSNAGQAAQGNVAVTASAGDGLTGGGSYLLGAGANLNFAVGAGNGIEVAADSVAVKLSGGVANDALVVNANGLDLKQTIAGNRIFSDNITINGGLTVAGTTTYVNTTNLEIADARILIASGSSAFTASQGFDFGGYAQLLTKDSVLDVAGGKALSSSLPLLAPEIKANTFYGSFVGAAVESMQSVSANATGSASIILANATGSAFALELPAASAWGGKIVKIKKSDNSENGVTVKAAGSDSIDGVTSIVLDSPYAAVMLVASGSGWYVF